MKNIESITKTFLLSVKNVLDSAYWNYEICHPDSHHSDFDKACDYLSTQKFSVKLISEQLTEYWSEIIETIRDAKNNYRVDKKDDFTNAQITAKYIADGLARERVMRFRWTSPQVDGYDSKKWFLCDSLIFKIIIDD